MAVRPGARRTRRLSRALILDAAAGSLAALLFRPLAFRLPMIATIADIPAPFVSAGETVPADWIDGNGHMNVAYYLLAFERGFAPPYTFLDFDYDLIARRGFSSMTVEVHIAYHRELLEGAPLRITTQLIDCDDKRAHWLQALYHAEENYLAASAEWLILSIDMRRRRAAALPEDLQAALQRVKAAHAGLPLPVPLKGSISIHNRRPKPA